MLEDRIVGEPLTNELLTDIQLAISLIASREEKVEDTELEDTLEEVETSEKEDSDDEETIETITDDELDEESTIKYAVGEEEFLAKKFYESNNLDYVEMFYGDTPQYTAGYEMKYDSEGSFEENETDMLSTMEAEDIFKEVQYAAIVGTSLGVSSEKKRKFDLWIKFNPALFSLLESTYSLTRNVDYKPLV